MTGGTTFAKALFLLFFFQDVVNVAWAKMGLSDAIAPFSSLKEVLIVVLLAGHWLRATPSRRLHFTSVLLTLVLALLFVVGVLRGVDKYPLDGVAFETRTLVLPMLVYLWGRAFVEARAGAQVKVEELVRFYTDVCVVFAVSAIADYAFLGDDFWTWVDVGSVTRAKGYVAASSGALPDNMYSFFFGRRALGLAFNPLNLAYILIPAIVFAYYRRQVARLALSGAAFVLSFSRLPILATAATIALAALPSGLRVAACIVGAIAVGGAVYLGRTTLFEDPSASGHFGDVAQGALALIANPLGEGIGAAGVYAGNYSALAIESAVLNTANQITLVGLVAYALFFAPGLARAGPLHRELRLVAAAYAITSVFAPQLLVIKSTFAFFFFLGANAALAAPGLRSARGVAPAGWRRQSV